MNFDERTKWTETLLTRSAVRDRKRRDAIVDELSEDIRARILRHETDHSDVMSVLKCVSEFESGMVQLIKIVRVYEGPTQPMQDIEKLYQQAYSAIPIAGDTQQDQERYPSPRISLHPILDRKEPVDLFNQLLDSSHHCRFMRLSGAAKMGKSHLLTKVFPALAQQQDARYVIMDMRGSQTVIDWLYHISTQLGIAHFPTFDKAYQAWLYRPLLQGQDIQAISSEISARSHQRDETPHYTRILVDDLRRLNDRPIVLLCDAVDDAEKDVQEWLMGTLLVQLQPLPHLHIVVGGRTLPEPLGNYTMICQSHELRPVEEREAFIRYCSEIKSDLKEDDICVLAHAFDYVPGAFVNIVNRKFADGSYTNV